MYYWKQYSGGWRCQVMVSVNHCFPKVSNWHWQKINYNIPHIKWAQALLPVCKNEMLCLSFSVYFFFFFLLVYVSYKSKILTVPICLDSVNHLQMISKENPNPRLHVGRPCKGEWPEVSVKEEKWDCGWRDLFQESSLKFIWQRKVGFCYVTPGVMFCH